MKPTSLLGRLRPPRPDDTVTVTLTGTARAVTSLARRLAGGTTVLSMRHTPTDNTTDDGQRRISVELTVHQPTLGGR